MVSRRPTRTEQPSAIETPGDAFFCALEIERTRALVTRDVAAIRRLHAPDYELISVPGRSMSLGRYLSLIEEDVFYASWEHGPMRVQAARGMAAVRYAAKITFPSGNVVDCWHTDIYALRSGSWVAVWSQATRLAPESQDPDSAR